MLETYCTGIGTSVGMWLARAVRRGAGLAIGLMAGTALDAVAGDPQAGHPVVAFGRAAGVLEERMWADSRTRGAVFAGACLGGTVALGLAAERAARGPVAYPVVVAAATWSALGARTLRREALALHALLGEVDLNGARGRLNHLVGRDPSGLDETQIARAAVESVAENTSDAVVAPLFWGAVAGIPGLLGYRAVNTLDAMVGYRSERYVRFGWASARLDDLANLLPARLTALLVGVLAPLAGGRAGEVLRVTRRDARRHPSPNSGWCEASFAAALGLRVGGTNVYGDRVEHRPYLGDGRPPGRADLTDAARLSGGVTVLASLVAALSARVPRR